MELSSNRHTLEINMDPALSIARDPPTLLTLPLELQDMIFYLSYSCENRSRLVQKVCSKKHQKAEELGYPVSGQENIRHHKVNDFLVSKAYFQRVAKAWMSEQMIKFEDHSALYYLTNRGIGRAFARSFEVSITTAWYCGWLFNLRCLTVQVDGYCFINSDIKCPWENDVFAEEWMQWHVAEELCELRGLRSFCIAERPHDSYIQTPDQRATFNGNLRLLEALIRSRVLLPSDKQKHASEPQLEQGPMPLYPGSQVRYDGPTTLPTLSRDNEAVATKVAASKAKPASDIDCTAFSHEAYTKISKLNGKHLKTEDMPDTESEMLLLVTLHGKQFMKWMEATKARERSTRELACQVLKED